MDFRLVNGSDVAETGDVKQGDRHGSRNPPWSRDELILALDLYLRHGVLDATHGEVVELSAILKALPIHLRRPDPERFRNPNGVSLKLANFMALDPSRATRGMRRHGRLDAEIWNSLGNDPALTSRLANEIRRLGASGESAILDSVDDEDEVSEGRLVFREHRARERNRKIVAQKRAKVREETGRLACEACDLDFEERYGERGSGYIEVHHLVPLAESGPATTRLSDLALVCANCHRMIHRSQPWMSPNELRLLLQQALQE